MKLIISGTFLLWAISTGCLVWQAIRHIRENDRLIDLSAALVMEICSLRGITPTRETTRAICQKAEQNARALTQKKRASGK